MRTKGFRCPSCGQAHKMIVDGAVVTMNEEMTILTVDGQVLEQGQEIELMFPDDYLTCPECDGTGTTQDWVRAFEDATIFFEMDLLCHCGGELWMDQIPGTNQYGFVCDKCNWVKPNAKVSGA